MILLAIIFIVFVNIVRWAELTQYTYIFTFKHYLMYPNTIAFNIVLIILTVLVKVITLDYVSP